MPEAEGKALFQRYRRGELGSFDVVDQIYATGCCTCDPASPDPRPVVGPLGACATT
jgi:hypothetical protein